MDYTYFLALLSFGIGALGGFQGIHDRYRHESMKAARTIWGFLYLLTRGALPAAVFCASRHHLPTWEPWLTALGSGVSWEVMLRSKFYLMSARRNDGKFAEILFGGLNLLRWYQGLFLDQMGASVVGTRVDYVKGLLPQAGNFMDLYNTVHRNVGAFEQALRPRIIGVVDKAKQAYEKDTKGQQGGNRKTTDEIHRHKLVYELLHLIGRKSLGKLFPD